MKSLSRWPLMFIPFAVGVIAVALNPIASTPDASASEPPAIAWARRGGGSSDDVFRAIDTDRFGNIYTTGNFKSTSTFSGTSTTLQSAGRNDISVIKWDKNGNLIWAKHFGSNGEDLGYDVATDKSNHIIICGTFSNSVQFGPYTLTSTGSATNGFVAKLDSSGNVLWAQAATGVTPSECPTDKLGNVLLSGSFKDTATWGSISKTSAGDYDAFVAKYDGRGNIQWVQTVSGSSSNLGRGVEIADDGTNDILLTGQFDGTQTVGTTQMASNGNSDVWVARLNPTGMWKWAKQIGGSGEDYGRGVSAKGSEIAIAGSFSGTVDFLGQSLPSSGGADVYVAKLNANGELLWVRSAGSPEDDEGAEINFDPNGNVLIVGSYRNSGSRDFLVALFDPDGNIQWLASPTGGSSDDVSRAGEADRFGNYLFAGSFRGTATFGTTTLTSTGGEDMVLGKINVPH
jgi:hypothetical protein